MKFDFTVIPFWDEPYCVLHIIPKQDIILLTNNSHFNSAMSVADEIGIIITRLAMADDELLKDILFAARLSGEELMPGDEEMLAQWARFVRTLRLIELENEDSIKADFQ